MAEIIHWYHELHGVLQIVVGVTVITWLPAGTATGAMLFAMSVRREPALTLDHWWGNVFGFWCAVSFGWVSFVLVGTLYRLTENHRELFSGLLLPGKKARQEAIKLRLLMEIGRWKEPLTLKQRRSAG